jgi:[ribosomal protein S5]-alanine N-acetyltransferase
VALAAAHTGGYAATMSERPVPVLETARLILTLPRPEDAENLVIFLEKNREHLRPWSPPEAPGMRTLVGARRRIESMHAEYRAGHSVRFWLFAKQPRPAPLLGSASLSNVVLGAFRACHLGYQLDREHEGHGLMHEALTAIIRYAFEDLRLHRVMANYLPTNERSGKVLRRLGFVVEGYARDYLFINGQFRDHVLTSLTNGALTDAERLCTPSV